MRITDLETVWASGEAEARARIVPEGGDALQSLWFRFAGLEEPLDDIGDACSVAMLPSCMAEGEPCRVDAAVSPQIVAGLGEAQAVLTDWYPYLWKVRVGRGRDAPVWRETAAASPAPGIACCFSGGVDSWYSLLKHRDRVTHLLLVRGFDIGLENDRLWQATRQSLARVAAAMDLRLITCETNLRAVADKGRAGWGTPFQGDFWGECLHGAALASVALMLSRSIGRLIIPATHTEEQLKPWGSSPRLDPHWSNGRVVMEHDGCEADRVAKVRTLATSDLALGSLRVCHNDVSRINCGRCEKCVRTMLALQLCGALDRARTFPDKRALKKVRRLEVPGHLIHHYTTLLEAARDAGDTRLVHVMETILGRRFSAERALAAIVRSVRRGEYGRRQATDGRQRDMPPTAASNAYPG